MASLWKSALRRSTSFILSAEYGFLPPLLPVKLGSGLPTSPGRLGVGGGRNSSASDGRSEFSRRTCNAPHRNATPAFGNVWGRLREGCHAAMIRGEENNRKKAKGGSRTSKLWWRVGFARSELSSIFVPDERGWKGMEGKASTRLENACGRPAPRHNRRHETKRDAC